MDVLSLSPLVAGSVVFQPRVGTWALAVVCKGTYCLVPGIAELADNQDPLHEAEVHADGDLARSLHAPADLVPLKPMVDVLLVGHAHAPRSEPARSLLARMTIGGIDKVVEAFCDRTWTSDGRIVEGPPLAKFSLAYEHAGAGSDLANVVGVRAGAPDAQGRRTIPSLQHAGATHLLPTDAVAPVGFGPIAARWPARVGKLGGAAWQWTPGAVQPSPFPPGFEPGFFNCAPPDQQLGELRDGERLVLENLHAHVGRFDITLPGTRPWAYLERPAGPSQDIPMRCDTLWIDTDRSVFTLVWRGQVSVDGPEPQGRVLIANGESRRRLAWADVRRIAAAPPEPRQRGSTVATAYIGETRLPLDPLPGARDLPFAHVAARPALPPPPRPPPSSPAFVTATPPSAQSPWAREAPRANEGRAAGPLPEQPSEVGLLASSNAAAAAALARSQPIDASPSAPGVEASADRARAPEAWELLWFDAASVRRVSRMPGSKELLARLDGRPPDADADEAGDRAAEDPEDRRDVFHVLAMGEPLTGDRVRGLFATAVRDDGRFVPPLALLAGELQLPFDELETLRVTRAIAAPLCAGDAALRDALGAAAEAVDVPGMHSSLAIVPELTLRIRDAFSRGKRATPPGYLEAQAERALADRRAYQHRTVLGGAHLRALFVPLDAQTAIPAYLPDALAARLPLHTRFAVRLIAEVHDQQDPREAAALALRVVALARGQSAGARS
jgi:hypothetical protein